MTITSTHTSTTTSTSRAPGRAANIALWTLQVLLAAVYTFSAVLKLGAEAQNVAGFTLMGLGMVGMYAVGALELAGAIALLVPRLAGLAALCLVALMIGAVTLTIVFVDAGMATIPGVVGVLVAVVAYGRRASTAALVAQFCR